MKKNPHSWRKNGKAIRLSILNLGAFILFCSAWSEKSLACTANNSVTTDIYTNTSWTSNAVINNTVWVHTGATLTISNCTLDFDDGVVLLVDVGGHLVVEGATLEHNSACGPGSWGGISASTSSSDPSLYIQDPGTHHWLPDVPNTSIPWIEIRDYISTGSAPVQSTISGAAIGVEINGQGIINANDATFIDNQIGIKLIGRFSDDNAKAAHNNQDPSADQIVNCIFRFTDLFPGTADYSQSEGIRIQNMPYMEIAGCTFENIDTKTYSGNPGRGTGAHTLSSNVMFHDQTTEPADASGCIQFKDQQCQFSFLSQGLLAEGNTVAIGDAKFNACNVGVNLATCDFPTVNNCHFSYSDLAAGSRFASTSGPNIGIYLENSSQYLISNNDMSSDNHMGTVFILVDGSTTTSSGGLFQGNSITWNGSTSSWPSLPFKVWGYNFLNDNTAVRLLCNTDANLQIDWEIDAFATMPSEFGNSATGIHNVFSNSNEIWNIDNGTTTSITYWGGSSGGTNCAPSNSNNVMVLTPTTEPETCPALDCNHGWPVSLASNIRGSMSVSIYPNPASDNIHMVYKLPQDISSSYVEIKDVNGRVVKNKKFGNMDGGVNISTKDLTSGIYFYTITAGSQTVHGKIIISK